MIDVPDQLSDEQQHAVDELSRAFGDDPRANLFDGGSDRAADDAKAGTER